MRRRIHACHMRRRIHACHLAWAQLVLWFCWFRSVFSPLPPPHSSRRCAVAPSVHLIHRFSLWMNNPPPSIITHYSGSLFLIFFLYSRVHYLRISLTFVGPPSRNSEKNKKFSKSKKISQVLTGILSRLPSLSHQPKSVQNLETKIKFKDILSR